MPGFQSFLDCLYHCVLVKLATGSRRVKAKKSNCVFNKNVRSSYLFAPALQVALHILGEVREIVVLQALQLSPTEAPPYLGPDGLLPGGERGKDQALGPRQGRLLARCGVGRPRWGVWQWLTSKKNKSFTIIVVHAGS